MVVVHELDAGVLCQCGHARSEHFFDGWGQPFGCCADGPEWAPGRPTVCPCRTWVPVTAEPVG